MTEKQQLITHSSIARMAGNIACGLMSRADVSQFCEESTLQRIAETSVRLAWLISKEIEVKVPR